MWQELELFKLYYTWELNYDLLRVLAKLWTLPTSRVGRWIQELCYRVLWLLPTAIYYSILKFDDRGWWSWGLWCYWLCQRLQVMRWLLWILIECWRRSACATSIITAWSIHCTCVLCVLSIYRCHYTLWSLHHLLLIFQIILKIKFDN